MVIRREEFVTILKNYKFQSSDVTTCTIYQSAFSNWNKDGKKEMLLHAPLQTSKPEFWQVWYILFSSQFVCLSSNTNDLNSASSIVIGHFKL